MEKRYPPESVHLPISIDLWDMLAHASLKFDPFLEPWEVGNIAIRDWLSRESPDVFANKNHGGYQWKKLFLPNGTVLRTTFADKHHHCRVESGKIVHDGKATSPSKFANAAGGVRRNAWQAIWVLFPDASTWQQAADFRANRTKRPSRKVAAA